MAATLAVTASATAAHIPLPSLATVPVAGESHLTQAAPGTMIRVDWIVADAGVAGVGAPGQFLYLYQAEVTAAADHIASFGVSFNTLIPGTVVSKGWLAGHDLDTTAVGGVLPHDAANYPNLAGELEGVGAVVAGTTVFAQQSPSNVNWLFEPVVKNPVAGLPAESETLWILSDRPPIYGPANAKDGVPPWDSRHPGGQNVPVPSPEPGEYLMAFVGLIGLCYAYRRNRRQATA